MTSVRDVLINIGYDPKDFGSTFRAKPLYRDSNNNTSLIIDKETGKWHDFGTNQGGDLQQLIKVSLGISSEEELSKYLAGYVPTTQKHVKIEQQKIYPKELLVKLKKDYSYWEGRGVSKETLELLQGGIADNGKMANRYVFPIFNSQDELVGFCGRSLSKCPEIKWKILGAKSNWCYPLKINKSIIAESGEVILLESLGDFLSLWEAGIKNSIVCFGVEVSSTIISSLIKLDVKKIILGFNNDIGNNEVGNKAAQRAKDKLSSYFDEDQIQIALPVKKDFGEMSHDEIILWKKNL